MKYYTIFSTLLFANIQAYSSSILDIQPNLESSTKKITLNNEDLDLELVNLNSNINSWFLLKINGKSIKKLIHIENTKPAQQIISLDSKDKNLSLIIKENQRDEVCEFKLADLDQDNEKDPYRFLCDNKLLIRHKTEGRESAKEAVSDFLRKNVWGGEEITSFVKDVFFKDKYKITSDPNKKSEKLDLMLSHAPNDAKLDGDESKKALPTKMLGIPIENEKKDTITNGHWYEMKDSKDIFVSGIEPGSVQKDLQESFTDRVAKLDNTESKALAFSIAFDLDAYSLGYVLGTDHPDVTWADRALDEVKDLSIPGPDGFDTTDPLVTTGKLSPHLTNQVVATFTAGFKRTHGAFKWGKLAKTNKGSHYGFIEQGVIFSTLQPDLATFIITKDHQTIMKTWTEEDNKTLLSNILHARQNGVPIIEGVDETTKLPKPSIYVNRWGQGNWSGSANGKQRSLRAGTCITKNDAGKRFLIYSYFSTITPSGMARVFQSYGCEYAMHMDMNALEHTYLATYSRSEESFKTHNLIQEMEVLDSKHKGQVLPRFLGMADNRDFFYIYKK